MTNDSPKLSDREIAIIDREVHAMMERMAEAKHFRRELRRKTFNTVAAGGCIVALSLLSIVWLSA